MRVLLIVCLVLFCVLPFKIDAQNLFTKYYNQNNSQASMYVNENELYFDIYYNSNMYILKTDTGFNPIWAKTFNPYTQLRAVSDDHSLYFTGPDAIIVKADSNGNVLWTRKLLSPLMQSSAWNTQLYSNQVLGIYPIDNQVLISIIQSDSVQGFPLSYSSIISLDTAGNFLWAAGDSITRFAIAGIYKSTSGGFWVAGNVVNNNLTGKAGIITKLTTSGNFILSKGICSSFTSTHIVNILPLPDSTYYLIGNAFTNTTGNFRSDILRIDENGDSIWWFSLSADSTFQQALDNIGGYTMDANSNLVLYGNSGGVYYLVTIDSSGQLLSSKEFIQPLPYFNFGKGIYRSGYYWWCGYNSSIGLNVPVFFKMDSSFYNPCIDLASIQLYQRDYCITGGVCNYTPKNYMPLIDSTYSMDTTHALFDDFCNYLFTNDIEKVSTVAFYPNPVTSFLKVNIPSFDHNNGSLAIFNSLGEIVIEKEIETEEQEFDFSQFPTGIYIAKVITPNSVFTSKIIKQ